MFRPPRIPKRRAARPPRRRRAPSRPKCPVVRPSVSIDVATPAVSTRNTLDEGFGESTALHEIVGELVGKVAERFTSGELDRAVDSALRQRVDQLIHEVWAGLEREAGSLDAERVFNAARAELLDFGPLGEFLKDSAVAEVGVQRFDRVTVVRSGRAAIVEPGFSSDAALKWTLYRLCEQSGTPFRADEAIVERKLPDGLSLRAVLGSAAPNGALLSLRRARRATLTLEELVRRGTVSRGMATLLQHAIAARINVLVVGPRDGGTQVLLGALALAAVEGAPVWISDSGTPPFSAMASLDPGQPLERLRKAVDVASRLPGARLVADLSTPTLASAVIDCIAEGADGVVASRAAPTLERGLARLAAELVVGLAALDGYGDARPRRQRFRPGRRGRAASRRALPRAPDRGDHRGERGRDPDERHLQLRRRSDRRRGRHRGHVHPERHRSPPCRDAEGARNAARGGALHAAAVTLSRLRRGPWRAFGPSCAFSARSACRS